jgi:sigma-B regulation protein RsbU (phosphoserine phosphatase)
MRMSPGPLPIEGELSLEIAHLDAEGVARRRARLTGITPELDRLEAETDADGLVGRVRFLVRVGAILLVSGEGLCSRLRPGVLEIEIQTSHPAIGEELVSRLAPFLGPRSREVLQVRFPGLVHGSNIWLPWAQAGMRLSQLVEVSGRINSSETLETLLGEIMEAAKIIMRAEASSLMLLDPGTGDLVIAVPTGPARAEISGMRIPAGKGFAGWVASHGEPLLVPEAEKDPRFFGEVSRRTGFRTRNVICVPLRNSEQQIIGVLQALNRWNQEAFTEDDIPLFLALADHAAVAIEKARLHREALEKQKLEKELSLAQNIQAGFWPRQVPQLPGFQIAGVSLPAAGVGGDYYDFIPLGDTCCAVVVADISGKGFSAALLMAGFRAVLRAQVRNRFPVAETVALLNNVFVEDCPPNRFVTMVYGELDAERRLLSYANCGHNPPLLFDGHDFRKLEVGGPIVGFRRNLPFQAGTVEFGSNQTLVLYTDGVVEAQNPEEEMFGEKRLRAVIRRQRRASAAAVLEAIRSAVLEFAGSAPQFDDLTLVVVATR